MINTKDFNEVYNHYEKTINFLVRKYNIEDNKTELLEHLWQLTLKVNLSHFTSTNSLDNFIFIVLKNKSINIIKKESIYSSKFICIYDQPTFVDNSFTLDQTLTNLSYESITQYLSLKEKFIIDAYFKSNFSVSEIANSLQISRQAIYKSLKKSLSTLYKELSFYE